MTTISVQTVPAGDPLTLASLPAAPTMIPSVDTRKRLDRQARAVIAASIQSARRPSRRTHLTDLPAPRSARSHLALNHGGTP